jgi:hypothetical protein
VRETLDGSGPSATTPLGGENPGATTTVAPPVREEGALTEALGVANTPVVREGLGPLEVGRPNGVVDPSRTTVTTIARRTACLRGLGVMSLPGTKGALHNPLPGAALRKTS